MSEHLPDQSNSIYTIPAMWKDTSHQIDQKVAAQKFLRNGEKMELAPDEWVALHRRPQVATDQLPAGEQQTITMPEKPEMAASVGDEQKSLLGKIAIRRKR